MKKLIATGFASLLAVAGLVTVTGESGAHAATSGYPAPTPLAAVTQCTVAPAGGKVAVFKVNASADPTGGLLQIKLHRVHTPSSAKIKITRTSYSGPVTKKLTKGTWHGTMVYLPKAGSSVSYCGIVFYNLHIK